VRVKQVSGFKILVVDDFPREFFDELTKYGKVVKAANVDEGLQLGDVDILVVRSKTKVDKELLNRMPSLKCVISATHGRDHVDVDRLRERGVEFHDVPVQSRDVAQGVVAYVLAHATKLVVGDGLMKRGEWKKGELKGSRIAGKTLGIIGYGRIGREVAKMASALGMNVVVYDPYVEEVKTAAALDELLEASDFVTVHVPFTKETKGMIGRKEISKMKDGAYLINTARGGIVDEGALLEALRQGKLGGAALDVYARQPPFNNETASELVRDDRVIATPHSIAQTIEAIEEKGEGVIRIIKDYVRKHPSNRNRLRC